MNEFIAKHQDQLKGVLSGFDRLVFQGHPRTISSAHDMEIYLAFNRIPKKDFGRHARAVSERPKRASPAEAIAKARPVIYMENSTDSKGDLARSIASRDGVREGLICVLTALEVCWSFKVSPDRESRKLRVKACTRKCLHLYHYWMDPELGFMSARIQSWFPFPIQVCMDGWAGVPSGPGAPVGAANGRRGAEVRAPGQLFRVVAGLCSGASPVGCPTTAPLAGILDPDRQATQPPSR